RPCGPSSTTALAPLMRGAPCRWDSNEALDGSARVMDENSRSVSVAWARTAPATRAISSAVSGSSGCDMGAASRVLLGLVAVIAALLVTAPAARAQATEPQCPAVIG